MAFGSSPTVWYEERLSAVDSIVFISAFHFWSITGVEWRLLLPFTNTQPSLHLALCLGCQTLGGFGPGRDPLGSVTRSGTGLHRRAQNSRRCCVVWCALIFFSAKKCASQGLPSHFSGFEPVTPSGFANLHTFCSHGDNHQADGSGPEGAAPPLTVCRKVKTITFGLKTRRNPISQPEIV